MGPMGSNGRCRAQRLGGAVLAVLALITAVVAVACTPTPLPSTSMCSTDALVLSCPYRRTMLVANGEERTVLWQVPKGTAPAAGWPTVVMFQGTGATPVLTWAASPAEPFGAYNQTKVVQHLLDAGYAVLTPATHLGGVTFWDTNNPLVPDYFASNDHALMLEIFDGLDAGAFGAARGNRLYATGISSGGYMTSRMGLAYPERFKALAVAAGSYATCIGIVCGIGPIPANHPPTLFLHGGIDPIVPLFTMDAYRDALDEIGVETRRVVDPLSAHRWIDASPDEVLHWFDAHP